MSFKSAKRELADLRSQLLSAPAIVRPPPPHPVDWAHRVCFNRLDAWQCEVMEYDGSDLLLNCTRQGGKTEVVSLRAAYRAKFYERAVGCLGPTSKQTSRMYRRARRWLMNDNTQLVRNVGLELEIDTGGRIEAFPGDRPDVSIRGDTLDDVLIDEASVIKDALIAAATPTTATKEDRCIIYLSTPKGQRGEFWKEWSTGDFWDRLSVTADDCPRISKRHLEKEFKRLGEALFRQEYYCEFVAAPGALFTAADIDALFEIEAFEGFTEEVKAEEVIW